MRRKEDGVTVFVFHRFLYGLVEFRNSLQNVLFKQSYCHRMTEFHIQSAEKLSQFYRQMKKHIQIGHLSQ